MVVAEVEVVLGEVEVGTLPQEVFPGVILEAGEVAMMEDWQSIQGTFICLSFRF